MPDPTPPHQAVPRRTVLGALAAGAVAALAGGCSTAAPVGAHAGRSSPSPTGARGVLPDVAVAMAALARIRNAAEVLDRTSQRHHGLRARLAGLSALHAAHLRMLQDAVPKDHRPSPTTAPHPERVARREPVALHQTVAAEEGLRRSLDDLAVRARSGEFARLLAAMSAAVGQQLAMLDRAAS